jgi:hypothetical protein
MEPRPKAREEEAGCGSAKLITYPFSLASEDGGSESYRLPTYYLRQDLRGSWALRMHIHIELICYVAGTSN